MHNSRTSNSTKLLELTEKLPTFCAPYFLDSRLNLATSTRLQYVRDINHFFDYLINNHDQFKEKNKKDVTLSDLGMLSGPDITSYLDNYYNNHSERTVARKRACLSAFFDYFCNIKLLNFNPVSASVKIKIPDETDALIYLTMDEQERLMASVTYGAGLDEKKLQYHGKFKKRDTALFSLALDTGMRVSELVSIDIQDIDMDDCSIIILRKGGKKQKVFFSDNTKEIIQDYLTEKHEKYMFNGIAEPLFTSLKGTRLSTRQVERLVQKYSSVALPTKHKLSPHKLRSSYAMALFGLTKDILLVQNNLGHKNVATTNIYAKATQEQARNSRNIIQNSRENNRGILE